MEARALWAILELMADKDGLNCSPTLERLEDECDRAKASVRKYLDELEALKWISVRPGWNEKTERHCLNITLHHGSEPDAKDKCTP